MILFTDGPAAGVTLLLRRAPLYLRVLHGPEGGWDALDQLTDEPADGETLHAYRRVGAAGSLHIHYTRGPSRCAWYAVATYAVVDPQPDDEAMRATDVWRDWCRAQVQAKGKCDG